MWLAYEAALAWPIALGRVVTFHDDIGNKTSIHKRCLSPEYRLLRVALLFSGTFRHATPMQTRTYLGGRSQRAQAEEKARGRAEIYLPGSHRPDK